MFGRAVSSNGASFGNKKMEGEKERKIYIFFGREETFRHFFWKIGKSLSSLGQKMKIKKRSFFFRFKSSKIKS